MAVIVAMNSVSCIPSSSPRRPTLATTNDSTRIIHDSLGAKRGSVETLYSTGQVKYQLELHSVVQTVPPDESHGPDTTQVRAFATLDFSSRDSLQADVTVLIDSARFATAGSASQPLPTSKVHLVLNQHTGQTVPSVEPLSTCEVQKLDVPFSGFEILPHISLPLKTNWADTVDLQICRAGINVRVRRFSTYTTTRRDPNQEIVRVGHAVISGTGKQWDQPVTVTGDGTSTDTISLGTTVPLRIDTIRGTANLEIVFASPLRTQHFQQTSSLTVVRR
jgi:hypothetical protein